MATSWLSSIWSHPVGARIAYYPSLLYGILKRSSHRRWYDRIDDKVILGALPFHKVARELVKEHNVGTVITLNEEYETRFLCPNQKQWTMLGVEQLCLPTVDFNNAPNLVNINRGLKFIDDSDHSKSVYIHCKAGRSRSAVVVLCYVMKMYRMDCENAIDFVRSKRPHIVLGTEHQKAIELFSRHVNK